VRNGISWAIKEERRSKEDVLFKMVYYTTKVKILYLKSGFAQMGHTSEEHHTFLFTISTSGF